jgi:hypothetical protein
MSRSSKTTSRRGPNVFLILGLSLLLCIGGVVVLVVGVFALTQPVVDAGNIFIGTLRDQDYVVGFDLASSDLQAELGSPEGLRSLTRERNVVPTEWTISGREITGQVGSLRGSVTLASGIEGTFDLRLVNENGVWKISAFNFSTSG